MTRGLTEGFAGRRPAVAGAFWVKRSVSCVLQTWQRPTLPRLETKYHRRWGVSRPCSEWERVQPPRCNHQVGEAHVFEKLDFVLLPWRRSGTEGSARPAGEPALGLDPRVAHGCAPRPEVSGKAATIREDKSAIAPEA